MLEQTDKAVAETIETFAFFYFWDKLNTPMKWIFVILVVAAITVGIFFFIRTLNKENDIKEVKDETEKTE